jgi:hypothetical protein
MPADAPVISTRRRAIAILKSQWPDRTRAETEKQAYSDYLGDVRQEGHKYCSAALAMMTVFYHSLPEAADSTENSDGDGQRRLQPSGQYRAIDGGFLFLHMKHRSFDRRL